MKRIVGLAKRILIQFTDLFASRRYLVLGDSHSIVFRNILFKLSFPFVSFKVISVIGATVSGLDNPNSKTNAYSIFRKELEKGKQYDLCILLLGEVDTGFVIWYRAKKHGIDVKSTLEKAVKNYCEFIEEIALKYKSVVISTPLPTIPDKNKMGEVSGLRKEVTTPQIERTNLTLQFNKKIKEFCLQKELTFIDLDKVSLNANKGIVKEFLLNKKKTDHHYDSNSYYKIISSALKEELN